MEKNILVTSAGRRVSLVKIIQKEIKKLDIKSKVITIDSSPIWSPACYISDKFYKVPKLNSNKYKDALLQICKKEKIGLIIPTIDTELPIISSLKCDLEKYQIYSVISGSDCLSTFEDKYKSFHFFTKNEIETPQTWLLSEYLKNNDGIKEKIYAKPKKGSCSSGIVITSNIEELRNLDKDNYIVQEKVNGSEYTINCFVNELGELVTAIPHKRIKIRSGEVCFAQTQYIPELEEIALKIVSSCQSLLGPFCFQAIKDNKSRSYKVLELNPRFGGGYPIADKAGGKFIQWLLEEHFSLNKTYTNKWKKNVRMLRYDEAIFL